MAQKRMFDKRVVESDKFTDLPNSSKALYFMAGMSADDKGFFQPRRLQKMYGFTDDDFKILLAKGYFIVFESGVMVVTDWNKNNWLDSRRVIETEYVSELNLLRIVNEKYELTDPRLADAKQMLRENRIEENRIEENRTEENSINIYGQKQVEKEAAEAKIVELWETQFIEFYKQYPKKVKKQDVKKWFQKNKPSNELFSSMMNSLEQFRASKGWQKDGGQFIPYPSTWLNQKRWEDEDIEISKPMSALQRAWEKGDTE